MLVTMRQKISGSRDGVDWPDPGETIDLPDGEAEQLVSLGLAVAGDAPADPPADAEESRKGARKATNEPT